MRINCKKRNFLSWRSRSQYFNPCICTCSCNIVLFVLQKLRDQSEKKIRTTVQKKEKTTTQRTNLLSAGSLLLKSISIPSFKPHVKEYCVWLQMCLRRENHSGSKKHPMCALRVKKLLVLKGKKEGLGYNHSKPAEKQEIISSYYLEN